jgi:hypothetical protein
LGEKECGEATKQREEEKSKKKKANLSAKFL